MDIRFSESVETSTRHQAIAFVLKSGNYGMTTEAMLAEARKVEAYLDYETVEDLEGIGGE